MNLSALNLGDNNVVWSSLTRVCVHALFIIIMWHNIQVLTIADPPPPHLVKRGHTSQPFYTDVRVMVPLIIALFALLAAATAAGLCWRHSK
jgi:uncharacterized membrane protein YwzB